jgi:hypothetical protein
MSPDYYLLDELLTDEARAAATGCAPSSTPTSCP